MLRSPTEAIHRKAGLNHYFVLVVCIVVWNIEELPIDQGPELRRLGYRLMEGRRIFHVRRNAFRHILKEFFATSVTVGLHSNFLGLCVHKGTSRGYRLDLRGNTGDRLDVSSACDARRVRSWGRGTGSDSKVGVFIQMWEVCDPDGMNVKDKPPHAISGGGEQSEPQKGLC